MRCLTLARVLQEAGAECHFICRDHPASLHGLIPAQGFGLTVLTAPDPGGCPAPDAGPYAAWLGADLEHDRGQTLAALKAWQDGPARVDHLVVDHYAIDRRWQAPLREWVRHMTVIDDLADRAHDADVLLDQNLGRQPQDYRDLVPAGCRCLVGTQYALLRPEFGQWRATSLARRAVSGLSRLTICLGGMDADNASGALVDMLDRGGWLQQLQVEVILGATAPHQAGVRAQIDRLEQQSPVPLAGITLAVGVTNMAERLAMTDLVIGAAGSSAWERCCLGVPTLVMVLAENQRSLAQALVAQGAAASLPQEALFQPAVLAAALRAVSPQLSAMQRAAAAVLDGSGAQRVAECMLSA